ncbi:hypothetical protein RF11_10384 [Thelohanellus kitauei]|uniref:Uncharacterized protein n=1 Tax=Thelohanellus kitauei TaxID=669202 RepID=A0A0C2NF73_THEKT|nr:hypothetical protein RF11_10384 [Thelohanellus kitauei]
MLQRTSDLVNHKPKKGGSRTSHEGQTATRPPKTEELLQSSVQRHNYRPTKARSRLRQRLYSCSKVIATGDRRAKPPSGEESTSSSAIKNRNNLVVPNRS